jgi:hypothetical protein
MTEDLSRRAERDFASLDDVEVKHCWAYEFTRLVTGLVRRVTTWRDHVPRKEGQDLFDAYRLHQGGRASSFLQIEKGLFQIPPGAYYLFPDWPDTAYLKIPREIRVRRLTKLSEIEQGTPEPQETGNQAIDTGGKRGGQPREIVPHPAEYGLNPESCMQWEQQEFYTRWDDASWERLVESLKENILRSGAIRAFRSDSEELSLFRISWAQSDKVLQASFARWLAFNRPIPFQKHGTLGRSHPLPKMRTDLDHLRKYLIVREAGTWKVTVGTVRLFRDRSKWKTCQKVVVQILADLRSYSRYSS